jgi:hypothetical protein
MRLSFHSFAAMQCELFRLDSDRRSTAQRHEPKCHRSAAVFLFFFLFGRNLSAASFCRPCFLVLFQPHTATHAHSLTTVAIAELKFFITWTSTSNERSHCTDTESTRAPAKLLATVVTDQSASYVNLSLPIKFRHQLRSLAIHPIQPQVRQCRKNASPQGPSPTPCFVRICTNERAHTQPGRGA